MIQPICNSNAINSTKSYSRFDSNASIISKKNDKILLTMNSQFKKIDKTLIFQWIDYLEGGNIKSFAQTAGINPSTIHRWKQNNTNPSIETVQEICKKYKITLNDFRLGPDAYENRFHENTQKNEPPKFRIEPADIDRRTNVYCNIGARIWRSKMVGSIWTHQFDQNPNSYIHILIDTTTRQPAKNLDDICVKTDAEPIIGDHVLVYVDSDAKIITWNTGMNTNDFEEFYGVVLNYK